VSDFQSRIAWNLLASDDEWTAPIMAEVGRRTGTFGSSNWYNYIGAAQPNARRLQTGKGSATSRTARQEARAAFAACLLGAKWTAPSRSRALPRKGSWRRSGPTTSSGGTHAQRLLVAAGQNDVLPALLELLKDRSVDEIGLNTAA